jgi:hypothetical protein
VARSSAIQRAVSDEPRQPFRFVAVDAGGEFHLALAYDHFVAGGDSIALLLRDIAERYTGGVPAEAPLQPRRCIRRRIAACCCAIL